jgi:hypothetical protein
MYHTIHKRKEGTFFSHPAPHQALHSTNLSSPPTRTRQERAVPKEASHALWKVTLEAER